jgi:hypothetical protein
MRVKIVGARGHSRQLADRGHIEAVYVGKANSSLPVSAFGGQSVRTLKNRAAAVVRGCSISDVPLPDIDEVATTLHSMRFVDASNAYGLLAIPDTPITTLSLSGRRY